MAPLNTSKQNSRNFIFLFIPVIIAGFLLTGCSTSDEAQSFRKNSKDEKAFSFYDYRNGDETHWKVYFKDDDISALYKNGRRIPDSEIKNYSDMIYDKIEDIADIRKEGDDNYRVFKFDDDNLKLHMNRLKDDLNKHKSGLKFKVRKDLKDEMSKLSIEMKKLKDKDLHIHLKPEFKEKMKKLNKEMKKLYSDSSRTFVFKFDGEDLEEELADLEEELADLAEDLKDIEIDIDIPEIDIDLEGIDESLKDLDIELKDLDNDLEKLDNFFDELKSEMVKDNLIKNEDDRINLKLEEDKMYVNDKEVPAGLYAKYKALYKKHTGKEFDKDQNIRLHITP